MTISFEIHLEKNISLRDPSMKDEKMARRGTSNPRMKESLMDK